VTAWTRQDTAGRFLSLAEIDGTVWCVIERLGRCRLERLDDALAVDAGLDGTAADARTRWSGLEHLPDTPVEVVADGAPRGRPGGGRGRDAGRGRQQRAGRPGLHASHRALAAAALAAGGSRTGPLRLVAATFRVLETAALTVDLGRGVAPVPFRRLDTPMLDAGPPRFTGDVTLRGIGWRRDTMQPLWRIEGATPLPMTLLSVTTETRMTD
jgi:hypothetical protein